MIILTSNVFCFLLFSFLTYGQLLSKPRNEVSLSASQDINKTELPRVTVLNGTYEGIYLPSFNQDLFLGIPFAQPPLKSLRFVNPQSLNGSFLQVREAKAYSPSCMNLGTAKGSPNYGIPSSEDCLYLNVIRPSGFEGPLPVAVWIYGGAFVNGASSRDLFNMSYIVEESVKMGKPIIGVSINYRLSGFGFLAGKVFKQTGNSNMGLRDQLKAFEWLYENIEPFGGNKSHIVIYGQSAGSMSIGFHLSSGRLNTDSIKGAILESGFATSGSLVGVMDSEHYNEAYQNVTRFLGCDNADNSFECLQSIENATKLLDAFNPTKGVVADWSMSRISIDDDYVPDYPLKLFESGNFSKIPIIVGATSDEGSGFTNITLSEEDLKKYLKDQYIEIEESTVNNLFSYYKNNNPEFEVPYQPSFPLDFNTSDYGLGYRRLASIVGDIMIIAPRRQACQIWSAHNLDAFSYRWNIYGNNTAPQIGATHSLEVVYAFHNNNTEFNFGSPQQLNKTLVELFNKDGTYTNHDGTHASISQIISKQWISFISTLNPNNHDIYGIPYWCTYNSETSPKKNYVYDFRSVYLEEDKFREKEIDYIMSIDKELVVAK